MNQKKLKEADDLCSDARNGTNHFCVCARHSLLQWKGTNMDRSYRLKMEELLSTNVLTREYLLNCVAKDEKKINDIAYKKKQYESARVNVFTSKFDELIEYRKPFIDVLMSEYHMSLDEIKTALQNVKEKNIPTKEVCNRIRDIILSGCYFVE